MGVDQVLLDPVGLVGQQTGLVQLAGGDHVVLGLAAAQGIAVDRQLGREAVPVPQLLLLGEGGRKHVRIEQPRVGHRLLVVDDLVGAARDVARELFVGHVRFVDAVGVLGGIEVAGDERRLFGDPVGA